MSLEEIREKYLKQKGVLNVREGTKFVEDKDTGRPAIVVYVVKKKPLSRLKKSEVVPPCVGELETDVVELAPKDWEIGKTSVSEKSLEEQRRKAGGVKR